MRFARGRLIEEQLVTGCFRTKEGDSERPDDASARE
jgi:hypothetical protein